MTVSENIPKKVIVWDDAGLRLYPLYVCRFCGYATRIMIRRYIHYWSEHLEDEIIERLLASDKLNDDLTILREALNER